MTVDPDVLAEVALAYAAALQNQERARLASQQAQKDYTDALQTTVDVHARLAKLAER